MFWGYDLENKGPQSHLKSLLLHVLRTQNISDFRKVTQGAYSILCNPQDVKTSFGIQNLSDSGMAHKEFQFSVAYMY